MFRLHVTRNLCVLKNLNLAATSVTQLTSVTALLKIKRNPSKCYNYSTEISINEQQEQLPPFEIPNKIHREPTDIINTLAQTVGRDPTASHYKYHDDPYLMPMSNLTKRTYAMAKEAGKKAARWIREEHRDLFQHKVAEPPIKAFEPQKVYDENSEVNEDILNNVINQFEVNNSIFLYKLMKTKNLPINNDLKQNLLELVSFYNHEDPISTDYIEERWLKQNMFSRDKCRKTWKDGDLAEELFNEIEPKTNKSYSAIIQGMCKYYQVDRAWHLFQEANEKNIEFDTDTYNAIISVVNFIKDTSELRWELVKNLLIEMNNKQLEPNINTLNSTLLAISTIGNYKLARSLILKTINEFKKLNIEPCLASWYYVLITLCRERGPVSHILVDIMNYIDGKEFEVQDTKDTYFFATAMDVCRNHLQDKNLANRVNNLLHHGNNYNFIGDSYKESIYYRHYFALLCETEPFDVFMETYDSLVPHIYIPEPGIMEEVLKAIDISGAIDVIPRIWSDMKMFEHINRESLITRLLKIMINNKPNDLSSLNDNFVQISWDIYTKIDESRENKRIKTQNINFNGQILGDILLLSSRGKNFNNAIDVFNKIDNNQHKIPGIPSYESMKEFINLCILENMQSDAVNCIEYCYENSLIKNSNDELVKNVMKNFKLSKSQLMKLKHIFGEDFN